MATRARGDVLQSPYEVRFDDYQRKAITVTIVFNNSTRSIISGTVVRDAGCKWTKLLVGLGADNTPDSTTRKVTVPEGTTNITKAQFTAFGVDTIEQFQAYQITVA